MSFARPGYATTIKNARKDNGITQEIVTSVILSGHRVVRFASGSLQYADKNEPTDPNLMYGLTLHAAAAGTRIKILTQGLVEEASWAWTPDEAIFLGNNGQLTQTIPTDGFSLIVGFAITSTLINFGIKMPIILEN